MTYKAFVSSTVSDLREHRAYVIGALRSSGFEVDSMEDWSADADAPREFSVARLKGCNLCILLVGFRRGYIPETGERSITQLEYDAARTHHIDVLPFLLEEVAADPAFDERSSDRGVDAWRETIRRQRVVGFFGLPPDSVPIESALARWVVTRESRRALRFRQTIVAALVVALLVLVSFAAYVVHAYRTPSLRRQYLGRFLAFDDPVLFNHSDDGTYEIARPIATYAALRHEANFGSDILATTQSFDILANNAQFVRTDQIENIKAIIRRGARVRFILWDYTPSNRPQYIAFIQATNQAAMLDESIGGGFATHKVLRSLRDEIRKDRKTYPGTLDFRWNNRPLFYTMWIRDPDVPRNALGHLSTHFYQGQPAWPSFRVSARDSSAMLKNMRAEFETAWRTSLIALPKQH